LASVPRQALFNYPPCVATQDLEKEVRAAFAATALTGAAARAIRATELTGSNHPYYSAVPNPEDTGPAHGDGPQQSFGELIENSNMLTDITSAAWDHIRQDTWDESQIADDATQVSKLEVL
jgi:hypothetical protein